MATTRGFSGKEFRCYIGTQDISAAPIGTAPSAAAHLAPTNGFEFRLNGINDIAWDAGYTMSELSRTGARMKRAEDVIQHYGSGVWTWDFDYTVDNKSVLHNLLNLIYPSNANGADHASGFILDANPTADTMVHGSNGSLNTVATIYIKNPNGSESRMLHSAVLQNLTLAMDAGTDSGRLKATGQFMSGYKPAIASSAIFDSAVTTSTSTKSLFDLTTQTVGGDGASVKAFSLTINNPASRIGFQGSDMEADGYVRGAEITAEGSITIKADDNAMNHIDTWQNNAADRTFAIVLNDGGTTFDISIPEAAMKGHNLDLADEGVFVELPFVVTSGANGGAAPITLKTT
tara:strand:+ start:13971 stop:15008 length:1038 start_codon:yes stop_codon:yes gene_type:complete